MNTLKQVDPIHFAEDDTPALGPTLERRKSMQQLDKLKLHIGLMNDALLHVEQYNLDERTALVAQALAIVSRL